MGGRSGLSGLSGLSGTDGAAGPYEVTLTIAAAADDGHVTRSGASYPPTGATAVTTNTAAVEPLKSLSAGTYFTNVGILRWDRGAVPSSPTLDSVKLRIRGTAKDDRDSRSLQFEWYTLATPGTITTADHTNTPAGDAGTFTLASIGTADYTELTLDFTSFPASGEIALRIHVTGGAPSGADNYLDFSAYDHATHDPPQLIINGH